MKRQSLPALQDAARQHGYALRPLSSTVLSTVNAVHEGIDTSKALSRLKHIPLTTACMRLAAARDAGLIEVASMKSQGRTQETVWRVK